MDVVMNPDDCIVSDDGQSDDQYVSVFIPAYYDTKTDTVYLSRYKNGSVAPVHVLDSIPDELMRQDAHSGELSRQVIVGFVFNDKFYTRAQALEAWNQLAEQNAKDST